MENFEFWKTGLFWSEARAIARANGHNTLGDFRPRANARGTYWKAVCRDCGASIFYSRHQPEQALWGNALTESCPSLTDAEIVAYITVNNVPPDGYPDNHRLYYRDNHRGWYYLTLVGQNVTPNPERVQALRAAQQEWAELTARAVFDKVINWS